MKKFAIVMGAVCVVAGAGLTAALGNGAVRGDEPAMMVSPQTIMLAKVSAVAVHTNVPAADVAPASLTLDGVAATEVWADDCGHVAARFAVADLDLAPADAVELTLAGAYADGGGFTATDVVRVK